MVKASIIEEEINKKLQSTTQALSVKSLEIATLQNKGDGKIPEEVAQRLIAATLAVVAHKVVLELFTTLINEDGNQKNEEVTVRADHFTSLTAKVLNDNSSVEVMKRELAEHQLNDDEIVENLQKITLLLIFILKNYYQKLLASSN